jgi:hypothetical protein
MPLPTQAELDEAIRRIALSPDGRLLYRRMQLILMDVSPSNDGGTLQRLEGRRSLARDLKLLMDEELAKGATTSDRRSGQHDPDGPAIQQRGEPVSVNHAGARRRVADDDREPAKPT